MQLHFAPPPPQFSQRHRNWYEECASTASKKSQQCNVFATDDCMTTEMWVVFFMSVTKDVTAKNVISCTMYLNLIFDTNIIVKHFVWLRSGFTFRQHFYESLKKNLNESHIFWWTNQRMTPSFQKQKHK